MPRRALRLVVLGWIGLLIVLPVVAYAFGARGRNIENRTLATGPPLTLSSFLHSGKWHQAAAAFTDHMPWRDRAIRWKAETEFNVFGDSPRPDLVLVGRGGWLFLREEFTTCELYAPNTLQQVVQAFGLAHAVATSSGRELYTLLIPAKATIEADHYRASHYSFEACPRAREQALEHMIARQPGAIDLWSALRIAKRREGDLWIPNDSHTDVAGSIAIARALVDAIRPSAWQPGVEQSGPTTSATGDLDILSGITDTAKRHTLVLHGAPKHPITTPVMLFGDSQIQDADPEIAPYFPNRVVVGLDATLFGALTPAQIRAGRVIVIESVQRTTYQRVVNFAFPLAFLDAFAPDVPHRPARYGVPHLGANTPLTLAAGVANMPVTTAHDDVRVWRLLIFTVQAAGAPLNVALLDPRLAPRTSPASARGALPPGAVVTLAIPPGTPLAQVRLSVDAPAGATLSPLQFAVLSGS